MTNGQRPAMQAPIAVLASRQLGWRPSLPDHRGGGLKNMPVSGIFWRSR